MDAAANAKVRDAEAEPRVMGFFWDRRSCSSG